MTRLNELRANATEAKRLLDEWEDEFQRDLDKFYLDHPDWSPSLPQFARSKQTLPAPKRDLAKAKELWDAFHAAHLAVLVEEEDEAFWKPWRDAFRRSPARDAWVLAAAAVIEYEKEIAK